MARGSRGRRLAQGIYEDASGLAATVSVGSGKDKLQREKRFPAGTGLKKMKDWQDETRVALRHALKAPARGTLAAKLPKYVEIVKPLIPASWKDRERDLNAWLPLFGHRRVESLTTKEITDQLLEWRTKTSARTCNGRRDALSHFYHWLAGRDLQKRHKLSGGPVEGAIRFTTPDPTPKALPLGVIDRVLAKLTPPRVYPRSEGHTSARLRLMRWTGARPSQLGRLRAEHFDLDSAIKSVTIPRGKRGKVVRIPLISEDAIQSAEDFIKWKAFEEWSCPSANKALAIACKAAGVKTFNLYVIKHSVASHLRASGADLADVQDTLGHTDAKTTAIYAPPVSRKQLEMFRTLEVSRAS
jgi:integrase